MPKRRSVKSALETANGHERGKDFLAPDEAKLLIEAAKRGRHSARDHAG